MDVLFLPDVFGVCDMSMCCISASSTKTIIEIRWSHNGTLVLVVIINLNNMIGTRHTKALYITNVISAILLLVHSEVDRKLKHYNSVPKGCS